MPILLRLARRCGWTPPPKQRFPDSVELYLDISPYIGMCGFVYGISAHDDYKKYTGRSSLQELTDYSLIFTLSGLLYPISLPVFGYMHFSKKFKK
jgi:hypothetical protein